MNAAVNFESRNQSWRLLQIDIGVTIAAQPPTSFRDDMMSVNEDLMEPVTTQSQTSVVDVAIIGGGVAGSLAAAVLARTGHSVVLVDKRAVYPDEFRVEKIAGDQVDIVRRLGFIRELEAVSTPYDSVLNIREGKVVDVSRGRNYSLSYAELVAMTRGLLPGSSGFVVDQVVGMRCSDDLQHISLASGANITARLVVLATGMSPALGYNLGITRRVVAAGHSVSFGFTIAPSHGSKFEFPALTCYGERTADGVDYLTLLPVPGGMRANLFMFRDPADPIMRELRREPKATLLRLMPGLQSYLGDFQVIDRVQSWVMDLVAVQGHLQPGVVLIGDAFQTSCPAAGTGVSRLLVDVERLCTVHLSGWLKTPGMNAEKIAEFYRDPDKIASDERAFKKAHFRQALTSNSGLKWNMRRRLHFLRRRITHRVDRFQPGWIARVRGALSA